MFSSRAWVILSLALFLSAADKPSAAASKRYAVVVGRAAGPLELYAASELRKYLRSIYGLDAPLENAPGADCDGYLIVGGPESNPETSAALAGAWPKVSDQGIVLKRVSLGGKPALVLGGGSPAATLWAVYEFVQGAGVQFLLENDVLPARPAPFPPGQLDVVEEPQLRFRSYRGINDLPTSLVFYGVEDYHHLIDQLAKMKFNVFYVNTYPFQPFVDYEFRGQNKTTGVLDYGWKLAVHSDTIGKELFGSRKEMVNPELAGATTYRERVQAASGLLHEIFRYAHSRGMRVGLMFLINQFPIEFNRRLPEWSDRKYLSPEIMKGAVSIRLGASEEGVDPASFPELTPDNPVVMDLNRTIVRAHIESYPEADYYGLYQPELPRSSDEYRQIWSRLDKKYHLEPEFDLDKMMESARTHTQPVGVRQGTRPQEELKTSIAYADTLDKLINEDQIIAKSVNPHATLVVSTFSDEFYPVLAKIFKGAAIQQVGMDYLSSLAAQRTGMLAFAAKTPMKVEVMASIADDNIGILPQLPTPSLDRIFRAMKSYHVDGFLGRQFLVTKLEAATAYVARSAWSDVTPDDVYRSQIAGVCGEASVPDMLSAYHVIERASLKGDEVAMGFLFPVPTMMQKHWTATDGPKPGWDALRDYYREALPLVLAARSKSRPEGYSYLDQLAGQLRFGIGYIEAVQEVRRARLTYESARKAFEAKDSTGYGERMEETDRQLSEALALLKDAVANWAAEVRDPSDLGALAALNTFCWDYLKGVAHQVYLESQMWEMPL